MAEYHLHNWSVGDGGDPWLAPELRCKRLHGYRCEDDRNIVTSEIVSVDGKRVTTYSGSIYILEEIDPNYLKWMQENGIEYNPENPIKVIVKK